MEWAFERIAKTHSDPFASNILGVTATEVRTDFRCETKPENLFYWNNSSEYYSTNIQNSNFTFEFKKSKYIFAKYRMKGILSSCAPYKWIVEGSEDGRNFTTLSTINRSLCNANRISSNCTNEEFPIVTPMIVKFVRFVQKGKECLGEGLYYLGLTSIDFYGFKTTKKISHLPCYKRNNNLIFLLFAICS